MAKKQIDEYPVVYCEWEDSEHEGSWSAIEEEQNHQLGICYSVGWLIHENEKRIVIASSVSQTEVGNKQYIPVKMITKRITIRDRRPDGKRRRSQKTPVDNGSGPVVPA